MALAFVDRPPNFVDADAVVSDNAGGARTAVAHLIAAGHRRIGFLGDRPEVFTAAERLRGYRETLAQHGLTEDLDLVRHPRFRGVDAYETTCELLGGSNPPTALFASQNLISVGAVRAVHALGLQHEIAMVSFDDILLADVARSRASPWWRRTRTRSGARRPSSCSRGSTATTGRRRRDRRPDRS